jgi:hypothetical protein
MGRINFRRVAQLAVLPYEEESFYLDPGIPNMPFKNVELKGFNL